MTPEVPADQYRAVLHGHVVSTRYKVIRHSTFLRYGPQATHWQVAYKGDWYRVWIGKRLPHLYVVVHRRRVPVTLTRRRYL